MSLPPRLHAGSRPLARLGLATMAAAAFAAMSACGDLSGVGGTSSYGCKAPIGVHCDSVTSTYFNSLHNNLPAQRARPSGTNLERMPPGSAQPNQPYDRADAKADLRASATVSMPLRSQPKVVRLWIKSWEDADHDLSGDMLVYMQVDNGRWLVDHAQQPEREAFAPIRAPRAAPATAAAPNTGNEPARPRVPGDADVLGDNGPTPLTQAPRSLQQSPATQGDH